MVKTEVAQPMFKVLVNHLVQVEEEREHVVKNYFPSGTEGKYVYEDLMGHYIKEIEAYLAQSKKENEQILECPFVIIGSIVEVEDTKSGEVLKFKIVCPFSDEGKLNLDYASCLSPMGKALLLKKVNEKITVETPAGKSCYKIISIRLPEEMYFT